METPATHCAEGSVHSPLPCCVYFRWDSDSKGNILVPAVSLKDFYFISCLFIKNFFSWPSSLFIDRGCHRLWCSCYAILASNVALKKNFFLSCTICKPTLPLGVVFFTVYPLICFTSEQLNWKSNMYPTIKASMSETQAETRRMHKEQQKKTYLRRSRWWRGCRRRAWHHPTESCLVA